MVSKPAKVNSASQIPTLELKQETAVEKVTSDDKPMKKVTENNNKKFTIKGPSEPVQGNDLVIVSGTEGGDELIRKAEERRKEEAEAKLKEQHRLEELAKANEARERKKRQAEKLQMRAELKEKEREKRLRKKEKKMGAAKDGNDINNSCETAPSSETTIGIEICKDIQVKDLSSVDTTKKPKKYWLFTKQSKTKSVPPPLRNQNKKFYQQVIRMVVMSVVLVILFWLGNMVIRMVVMSVILVILFWLGNMGVYLKRRSHNH